MRRDVYGGRPIGQSVTLLLICVAAILTLLQPVYAQGWQIGRDVGLRKDTCIRVGPGLSYRAHTKVPEDNWTVRVIGGPKVADGHAWYDTSRRAAGDPSGGTGWVTEDQTDTDCFPPGAVIPGPPASGDVLDRVRQTLDDLRRWWDDQGLVVKWAVALGIIVLLVTLWRRFRGVAVELLGAVLGCFLLWWLMDVLRPGWQSLWNQLAGPSSPDLALLVALIPLVSVALSFLFRGR